MPAAAYGLAHEADEGPSSIWRDVATALAQPAVVDEESLREARQAVAADGLDAAGASEDVGRLLVAAVSDPRIRLDPLRGAVLLERFVAESGVAATFWSEFALATLHQLAGEHRRVAGTLARALHRARSEDIAANVVARTTGILGHAQQSSGLLSRARATFEGLRDDPYERGHAAIHLGELALTSGDPDGGLEIWLSHPGGTTVAVTVLVEEVDALWTLDPAASYRLVEEAIARLRALVAAGEDAGLETAFARLGARARSNAAPVGVVLEATNGGDTGSR